MAPDELILWLEEHRDLIAETIGRYVYGLDIPLPGAADAVIQALES